MRKLIVAALVGAVIVVPAAEARVDAAPPFAPKAAETATQVIAKIRVALKTSECSAQLKALFYSGLGAIPAAGCTYLRTQLGTFARPEARTYGTGAVVSALVSAQGKRSEIVLVLDKARKYRIAFVEGGGSFASTRTRFQEPFDDSFVIGIRALESKSCDEFLRVAHVRLGVGAGAKATVCARVRDSALGSLLAADRRAVARRLDGSSQFAFYGIRFTSGRYFTVVMVQQPITVYMRSTQQYAFVGAYEVAS